jgi:hypothetical protein
MKGFSDVHVLGGGMLEHRCVDGRFFFGYEAV